MKERERREKRKENKKLKVEFWLMSRSKVLIFKDFFEYDEYVDCNNRMRLEIYTYRASDNSEKRIVTLYCMFLQGKMINAKIASVKLYEIKRLIIEYRFIIMEPIRFEYMKQDRKLLEISGVEFNVLFLVEETKDPKVHALDVLRRIDTVFP